MPTFEDNLFTRFSRENRPLSLALNHRAKECLRVHLVPYSEEEKRTLPVTDLVAGLVAKITLDPPALGEGVRQIGHSTETSRPLVERGAKGLVHIFTFALETTGDAEWLAYWPDQVAPGVDPVDAGFSDDVHEQIPADEWTPEAALTKWEQRRLASRWSLRSDGETRVLTVRVDVTPEDVLRAADSDQIKSKIVHDWIDEIRPIIDAISAQVRDFNTITLPTLYTERITELQRNLRGFHRISTEIEIPFERLSQPELTVEPVDGPGTEPTVTDVVLDAHRLSKASFEDVVRTIRVWGSGVERYPRPYSQFTEDMLSDTLCVTLNAALPGADREVYRKAGKTDVTVRANAVDEGLGPETVFVCENKIWGGRSEVPSNVDQLRGYLDARDTAAVLLYCVRIKNMDHAKREALSALREVNGFVREVGHISEWPLLRLERDGRGIDLLVAFVHTYDQKADEKNLG
ncbi:hypothetical protein ACFWFR_08415 [Oerskovia sp. NPDC060287]|uniref:hypothetical protein n=1 Tax=Oerskovia sp. NPDC060287 TaxID=3347095 RepID=UPI00364FAE5C